ncbi:hypothetical protein JRQ81_004370, partial [Phrynocephalus forsythii]
MKALELLISRFQNHAGLAGLSIPESPTNVPPRSLDFSTWNLSWVMKDSTPLFTPRGRH